MSETNSVQLPTKEDLIAALGDEAVAALLSDPALVKPSNDAGEADIVRRIGLVVAGGGCECAACAKIRAAVAAQPGGAALTEEWTAKNVEAIAAFDSAREFAVLRKVLAAVAASVGRQDPLKDNADDNGLDAKFERKSTTRHEISFSFTTDAGVDDTSWQFAEAVAEALFRTMPDRALVTIARSAVMLEPVLLANLEKIAAAAGEEYVADDFGAPYIAAFSLADDAAVVTRFALTVEDLETQRAALAAAKEEMIRWTGSADWFTPGTGLFAHAGVDPKPFVDFGNLSPEDVARHVRAWILYGPGLVTFADATYAAVRELGERELRLCARVAKRYGWATDDRIATLNKDYAAE